MCLIFIHLLVVNCSIIYVHIFSFFCRFDANLKPTAQENDPTLIMPRTKGKSYAQCHLWKKNISRKQR